MKFKGTRKKLLAYIRSLDGEYRRQQSRLDGAEMKVRFYERHAAVFVEHSECPISTNHVLRVAFSPHQLKQMDRSVLVEGLSRSIAAQIQEYKP